MGSRDVVLHDGGVEEMWEEATALCGIATAVRWLRGCQGALLAGGDGEACGGVCVLWMHISRSSHRQQDDASA